MLDIGWSELLVIAVVAILVVGPKDLPMLLRTIGRYVGTLRKMAGEFRGQFDQAMREAELQGIRDSVNSAVKDLKAASPMADIKKAVEDSAGSIRDIPQAIQGAGPAAPANQPAAAASVVPTPAVPAQTASVQQASPTIPITAAAPNPATGVAAAAAAETDASVAMAETLRASGRSSVAQRAAAAWSKAANDSGGA